MGIKRLFHAERIRSSYYKKVLRSFLLCSCAVALLFSGILLFSSNRDYGESLASAQEQIIDQAVSINATNLTDIVTYCSNLLTSSTAQAILYGSDLTTTQSFEALEMNTSLMRISSLIDSVYFINFRTGTVIDQKGRVRIENHPDADIFQRLSTMQQGRGALYCVPREMSYLSAGHVISGKQVVSIIFYQNSAGALVVNLDQRDFAGLFAVNSGEHVRLTMVNASGEVFVSADPADLGRDISETSLYKAIEAETRNRGEFPFTSGGVRTSVRFVKNQGLGITYICTRDSLPFYSDNRQLLKLLEVALLLVAVGVVLSIVLSRLLYDPLKRLKQLVSKVRPAGENANPYDDFGYLASAYQEIAELNSRLQENSSTLRNTRVLAYLLYDLRDNSVTASELEALDASFPEPNYAVLALGLDPGTEEQEMDPALLKFAIQNVCQELITPVTGVYHVAVNSDLVVLLLNFSGLDICALALAVEKAQAFIAENFQCTFSAGLGDTVHDLTDLGQSFAGARQAYARRFLTGSSSFHQYAEPGESAGAVKEYPYAVSQALLDGVRGMSEGEVRRQAAAFFDAIRGCGIDEILSFTIQLHFTLQRLERQSYISVSDDWSYKALEKSTLSDIERRVVDRCLYDIGQLVLIREASEGRRELIEQIRALAEDNLYNPELSVAFIADRVHLSVNYLRNVFKESTGDSLSAFINQRKIELICHLLTETDMTLSEINDKLGFSTSNYFYAFFKKHMGMTPGDYRKRTRSDDRLVVEKLK